MEDHTGRAEDALKLKMLMEHQEIPHDRNGGPTNASSVPLNLSSQGVNFTHPMPLHAWTHKPTWRSTMPGTCSPHGGSSAPPMPQNGCGQAATNASMHQQLVTAPLQPAMPRSKSSENSKRPKKAARKRGYSGQYAKAMASTSAERKKTNPPRNSACKTEEPVQFFVVDQPHNNTSASSSAVPQMSDADLVFEHIDEKLDEMRHERYLSFCNPNASVEEKRQNALRIIFCERYMDPGRYTV